MDIKKPDSPLFNGGTPSITRQTGTSQNQTTPQPDLGNFKLANNDPIKIGQQIELLVIKITSSEAILDIIGSELRVHTTDKELLQIGQQLKAQITSTEPLLQLKILNQPTAPQSAINSTLRQIMPLQQSIKGLLENIQLLTTNSFMENSPALKEVIHRFSQSLPPMEAYKEAQILPEILRKSGLFTEHLLAQQLKHTTQQYTFPNNDLKIALLRLAEQLRNLQVESHSTNKLSIPKEHVALDKKHIEPVIHTQQKIQPSAVTKQESLNIKTTLLTQKQFVDKLLNQTDGVIARIQTLQLQHAQTTDQNKPAWLFELPVRTNTALDHMQIYIEQDNTNTKNKNYLTPWKVILKFDIKELGAIQAHITLQGSQVSVNFWTENRRVSTLFSEHFNLLTKQFDKAGLETGHLNCRCDKAPEKINYPDIQLIDETT